jgi:hypothetical protein
MQAAEFDSYTAKPIDIQTLGREVGAPLGLISQR